MFFHDSYDFLVLLFKNPGEFRNFQRDKQHGLGGLLSGGRVKQHQKQCQGVVLAGGTMEAFMDTNKGQSMAIVCNSLKSH